MRTERLKALADGIFAIELTLLVLELPVPEGSDDLAHAPVERWPFYAAYVVTFATIAIVWIDHRSLLDGVAHADRALLELNLLLLLFVVGLVPWPTGLLAEYLRDGAQSSAAAVTYGLGDGADGGLVRDQRSRGPARGRGGARGVTGWERAR